MSQVCSICYENFHLTNRKFEIIPSRGVTGILCTNEKCSVPVCNYCLIRMYPWECPVCKEDWKMGKPFGIPEEISEFRKQENDIIKGIINERDNFRQATDILNEDLRNATNYSNIQNAVLLQHQVNSDAGNRPSDIINRLFQGFDMVVPSFEPREHERRMRR